MKTLKKSCRTIGSFFTFKKKKLLMKNEKYCSYNCKF